MHGVEISIIVKFIDTMPKIKNMLVKILISSPVQKHRQLLLLQ